MKFFLFQHYSKDADGLCCRLVKPLNNRYDTVDAMRTGEINRQSSPSHNTIPSPLSSLIDFKELQMGKVVGTGEFAGRVLMFFSMKIIFTMECFSEVYEGTYRNGRVAIKVLKEPTSYQLFLHEAEIMK